MNDRSVIVRDLVKRFGSFTAVDHINLETSKGEIFGFLGPARRGVDLRARPPLARRPECQAP